MRVGLSSQTESQIVAYVTFMKDKRYDRDLIDLYEGAVITSMSLGSIWHLVLCRLE